MCSCTETHAHWPILYMEGLGFTHGPLTSSFLGLPYRTLDINHKDELLRGLWVGFMREVICPLRYSSAYLLQSPIRFLRSLRGSRVLGLRSEFRLLLLGLRIQGLGDRVAR